MNYNTPTSYIDLGWYVVPLHTPQSDGTCSCSNDDCDHVGKHPRVRDWQRCAARDDELIRKWWGTWPRANVGIVTGQRSGLLVLDVDPGADHALVHSLPKTPTATTGKGHHYYFTHPGVELPNAVRFKPGFDIRTDGGLVVAPPSLHASGARYRWLIEPATPLADCPAWLIDAVLEHANKKAEATRSSGFAARPTQSRGGQPYALAALENELHTIRSSANGERNNQLNKSAFVLGTLIKPGQLDADEVHALLVDAGISAGLAADDARRTARSGLRAGMQHPREIAPPQRPDSDDDDAPPRRRAADLALAPVPDDLHNTDLGNAARFAEQHRAQLRYVPKWESWLLWDGTRWQRDNTLQVYQLARRTIRAMYAEASNIEEQKERKDRAIWALKTENKGRLEAMLSLAQSESGLPIAPDQLDAQQYAINCTNGTLDLQTGELCQHQQSDLITKRIEVQYQPDAACPTWLSFLRRVMADDDELITYVQRCIGYTLTGSTQEQCLFFAYGTGRNGKSTFFETLLSLLGEYGQKAPTELIMARAPNVATNDVARLAGARMVVTAEIEEGRRLSESLVKDLTGGDTMVARFLYQELFEFTATHKLWVYGNHKPEIKGTDPGIWRRIRVIPFAVQIPREEVDPQLKRKLLAELPGILAWAVRGCLDHQQHGLTEPAAVHEATQAYRTEMDVLAAFMRDCCIVDSTAQAPVKELYQVYRQWCEDGGERAVTQRRLAMQLTERSFDLYRSNGKWYRLGMGILNEEDRYNESSDPSDPRDPVFMTPHEAPNFHESHEKTHSRITRITANDEKTENEEISTDLPPLGREIGSGATIETGLTAVRLSAEQWHEARELYDASDFNALYKLATGWKIGYQRIIKALKEQVSDE